MSRGKSRKSIAKIAISCLGMSGVALGVEGDDDCRNSQQLTPEQIRELRTEAQELRAAARKIRAKVHGSGVLSSFEPSSQRDSPSAGETSSPGRKNALSDEELQRFEQLGKELEKKSKIIEQDAQDLEKAVHANPFAIFNRMGQLSRIIKGATDVYKPAQEMMKLSPDQLKELSEKVPGFNVGKKGDMNFGCSSSED